MKKDDVPLTNEEFNKKFRKRETQRLLEARPFSIVGFFVRKSQRSKTKFKEEEDELG